jgi:methylmalonyl-CoA mutase N-terminal domain/subunit
MALDPDGFVHVADDGVARSYAANNTVIDYAALSNSQIQQMISQLPASYQEHLEHLRQVFEGVNGYDVANKSQLLTPPPWLQAFEIEPTTPPQQQRREGHTSGRSDSSCVCGLTKST